MFLLELGCEVINVCVYYQDNEIEAFSSFKFGCFDAAQVLMLLKWNCWFGGYTTNYESVCDCFLAPASAYLKKKK